MLTYRCQSNERGYIYMKYIEMLYTIKSKLISNHIYNAKYDYIRCKQIAYINNLIKAYYND